MSSSSKAGGASSGPSTSQDSLIPVESLNSLLTCSLCTGYLHNAVTITECLHSFCKGCLVKYVAVNLHCPRCRVLIHPTDPLVNIRHDSTMQDIVYKLLPHIEEEEQKRERQFYSERGMTCDPKDMIPSSPFLKRRQFGRNHRKIRRTGASGSSGWLGVELKFAGVSMSARDSTTVTPLVNKYLLVPANAKIMNVQNFLRKKLNLNYDVQASLFVGTYLLHESLTLSTVCNVFFGSSKKMITLHYGILRNKDFFSKWPAFDWVHCNENYQTLLTIHWIIACVHLAVRLHYFLFDSLPAGVQQCWGQL